ncbi:hypothetical protein PHYPSEUDO_011093 [Phytophthora pseudosyringae]|uniref:Uncharacterized protein n=1 Tax=Phytophthora pseudosyringae TaxID=221518 RepID=A0A8T1W6Y4_9STRA|nr:hypothetical protein PHYPSEUDO_011093 [Phytophthora pseudosyringae]
MDFKTSTGWSKFRSRFRYIQPGGNPSRVEGDDFLLDEEAVLRFISNNDTQTLLSTGGDQGAGAGDRGGGSAREDESRAAPVASDASASSEEAGDDVILVDSRLLLRVELGVAKARQPPPIAPLAVADVVAAVELLKVVVAVVLQETAKRVVQEVEEGGI